MESRVKLYKKIWPISIWHGGIERIKDRWKYPLREKVPVLLLKDVSGNFLAQSWGCFLVLLG